MTDPSHLRSLEDRFWPKVDRRAADECWPWIGSITSDGYGKITNDERQVVRAHRIAYELANGQIPTCSLVCHSCDNRRCCNPAHLWLGTIADNNRDMTAKGRNWQQRKTHCQKGHPYSEENTYRLWGKHRRCRICVRIATENWRQRKMRAAQCLTSA